MAMHSHISRALAVLRVWASRAHPGTFGKLASSLSAAIQGYPHLKDFDALLWPVLAHAMCLTAESLDEATDGFARANGLGGRP